MSGSDREHSFDVLFKLILFDHSAINRNERRKLYFDVNLTGCFQNKTKIIFFKVCGKFKIISFRLKKEPK